MRIAAWFSPLWDFLKNLGTDHDPLERLEVRVTALERKTASILAGMPPDTLTPSDQPSGAASRSGRP